MNVGYLLANSAAKCPEAIALVDGGLRRTFAELEARTAALAGAMLAAGLRSGQRVGLLFYNSIPLVETYFAALRVGLVATPVNFRLTGREMAYILNDSQCQALFFGPEFSDAVAAVAADLETVRFFVSPGGRGPDPAATTNRCWPPALRPRCRPR